MSAKRFFLATQDELVVWLVNKGYYSESARFVHSEEGFRQFDACLRDEPDQVSRVIVDVIEEEFVVDAIPALSARDRNSLIERRLARKFPRSPYRIGLHQGRADRSSDEHELLLCSVSNEELLDPWLRAIARNKVPLAGIHSVPLLAPQLLSRLARPAANALLLTQHQENRLRQVFLRNDRLKSARLSQSPAIGETDYGEFIVNEIQRSRRYLERARLLSAVDALDVYLVASQQVVDEVLASNPGNTAMQLHCIEPGRAAKIFGMTSVLEPDRLEALYLASTLAKRPAFNYAVHGETRYSTLRQARSLLIGSATAAAIAFAAVASVNLMDAVRLQQSSAAIEQQLTRMTETYRNDNESLQPLRADTHEMKVAVDTGNFILQNRVPVPWVMNQLGAVLGDFPTIGVDGVSWQAESAQPDANAQGRAGRGEAMPVPVREVTGVSAELHGRINSFDDDLRDAFAMIDRLAEALQDRTAFDSVIAVEYPLDARPQVALSGAVAHKDADFVPRFRLRLTKTVPVAEIKNEGW
ncbi:MAG: hypothetical protein RLN69_16520 [Woeseiaceae bacterium]